jgi:hypothetical protein
MNIRLENLRDCKAETVSFCQPAIVVARLEILLPCQEQDSISIIFPDTRVPCCPYHIKNFTRQLQFRASSSILRLIWISLLHNVVSCVRKRTARFRCVFGSTDAYRI